MSNIRTQAAFRLVVFTTLGLLVLGAIACSDATQTPPVDAKPVDAFVPTGDPCSAASAAAPGDADFLVTMAGQARRFLIHTGAPARRTPTPLVLNFHGFTNTADLQQQWTGMDAAATREGYIVVYPQGIGNSWNAGACCGDAVTNNVNDVGFARELVTWVAARYCVDLKRVYATGFSNGGFLSHRLACEAADVFAAVAPISALNGMPTCTPSRPVPVLMSNGTADSIVPIAGNPLTNFPPLSTTIAGWRTRNQCSGAPVESYLKGSARCEASRACAGNSAVESCIVTGAFHNWPGGTVPGVNNQDLNVTDYIWQFFLAHRMP